MLTWNIPPFSPEGRSPFQLMAGRSYEWSTHMRLTQWAWEHLQVSLMCPKPPPHPHLPFGNASKISIPDFNGFQGHRHQGLSSQDQVGAKLEEIFPQPPKKPRSLRRKTQIMGKHHCACIIPFGLWLQTWGKQRIFVIPFGFCGFSWLFPGV